MNYSQHCWKNIKVAARCLVLFFFHLLHAFLPFKWTSHEQFDNKEIPISKHFRLKKSIKKRFCIFLKGCDLCTNITRQYWYWKNIFKPGLFEEFNCHYFCNSHTEKEIADYLKKWEGKSCKELK